MQEQPSDGKLILNSACAGFMLCLIFSAFVVGPCETQRDVSAACGPCDHVAECGKFKCEAGKDGWQRKRGE